MPGSGLIVLLHTSGPGHQRSLIIQILANIVPFQPQLEFGKMKTVCQNFHLSAMEVSVCYHDESKINDDGID